MKKYLLYLSFLASFFLTAACVHTPVGSSEIKPPQSPDGAESIHQMAGCFLVDYNYVETQALKAGYHRNPRIYDVDRTKTVKEWIYAEDLSPHRIRLQHILFAVSPEGHVISGSELRHQAEDWDYKAASLYEYEGPSHWKSVSLDSAKNLWTRKITNLDDGLRYQCAAAWANRGDYSEWVCDNYAPIPGRETRDMKRKDYNALQRSTHLMIYGPSWLERQDNVKTIDKKGRRISLAREMGKNWYVRLPDSECEGVQAFVSKRQPFWSLEREVWDDVLSKGGDFLEKMPSGQPPRFAKMMDLEDRYLQKDLSQSATRSEARAQMLKVIQEYRK